MNILAIARFTFQEARRRRLLWLGMGLGLAFLALFGLGFYFVFDDIRRSVLMEFVGKDEQEAMLSLVANMFPDDGHVRGQFPGRSGCHSHYR